MYNQAPHYDDLSFLRFGLTVHLVLQTMLRDLVSSNLSVVVQVWHLFVYRPCTEYAFTEAYAICLVGSLPLTSWLGFSAGCGPSVSLLLSFLLSTP